jgi:8-oxo-dGTP pyrophosphatase MutT (NUDIX family)
VQEVWPVYDPCKCGNSIREYGNYIIKNRQAGGDGANCSNELFIFRVLFIMKKKECSGGFIQQGNRFLFGKRSLTKDWAPGLWDIVGGKARKKEDGFDTLQRETWEEVGIVVISAILLKTIGITDESGCFLFTYHIYMITEYKGTVSNCSNEHTAIEWFTRDELALMDLALPAYVAMIDDWLKRN